MAWAIRVGWLEREREGGSTRPGFGFAIGGVSE